MKKTHKENLQFLGAISLALVMVASIAYSNEGKAGTACKANIAVYKSGQPLLQPAKLSITNQRTGELITSTTAHQLSTEVVCGIRYEVASDIAGIIKKQTFDVNIGSVTTVTLHYP